MRKLLSILLVSVSLGACTTTQVTDFLKKVQADAATTCLFVPTIDTILSVATALGIPWGSIVGAAIDTVAKAICSQVPPPASAQFKSMSPLGAGPAKTVAIPQAGPLHNIPINGWRTK